MQLSKLHFYSIGYAAENKKLTSHELEVYPAEVMGYLQGDVNSDSAEDSHDGVDAFGQNYSVPVNVTNSIKAHWYSFGSNRKTPPDIRRGEQVVLMRFADVDKYYWLSTNQSENLRRLETVIYAFSNVSSNDEDVELDGSNTYYIEISTHNKTITLVTNKNDGEAAAYTFQFNTKEGSVTLQDDIGNFLELLSVERKWTLQNADQSRVVLDKDRILIESSNEIRHKTRKYIVDCETVEVNAKASITETSPLFQGNIGASTYTGTLTVKGLGTFSGGISFTSTTAPAAACSISIPITATSTATFNGDVNTTATLTNQGKVVGAPHQHTSTAPGSPTSSVN